MFNYSMSNTLCVLLLQAFLQTPSMKDADRREILGYFLCCSCLLRTPADQLTTTRTILAEIQRRFFADTKFYQPSIKFTDIHNVVDEIFRLEDPKIFHASNIFYVLIRRLYEAGLQQKSAVISLRAKLLVLAEDEAVRCGLEAVFAEFLLRPSLHPASGLAQVQHCLLSLL